MTLRGSSSLGKNLRPGIVATNTTWLCAEHFTSDQFTIHTSVTKIWIQKIDLSRCFSYQD